LWKSTNTSVTFVGRERDALLGKTIGNCIWVMVREKVMKHIEFFRENFGSEVVVVQEPSG